MNLNEITVFVKVVQTGSFSQAARQLGMPNSTVSAKVSALERRLGVSLLQRTTRKLNVTQAGEAYFRRCMRGLQEIEGAEAEVAQTKTEPSGDLRVTAPIEMAEVLPSLIVSFLKEYPKVNLEFIFTDRFVDLVGEGVDLAIRAGKLEDSTLVARRLGLTYWCPVASPAYLKRTGQPTHPKELTDRTCIQLSPFGAENWELSNAKARVEVPLKRRLIANHMGLIKALAISGEGIALLPTFQCLPELKSGKLVRVLPAWRANIDPVQLVYPGQKFVSPKIDAFIEASLRAFEPIFRDPGDC